MTPAEVFEEFRIIKYELVNLLIEKKILLCQLSILRQYNQNKVTQRNKNEKIINYLTNMCLFIQIQVCVWICNILPKHAELL